MKVIILLTMLVPSVLNLVTYVGMSGNGSLHASRGGCWNMRLHGETWDSSDGSFRFRCNNQNVEFLGCNRVSSGIMTTHPANSVWCESNGWLYKCSYNGQKYSVGPVRYATSCIGNSYRRRQQGECFNGKKHGEIWTTKKYFRFRCEAGKAVFRGCLSKDRIGYEELHKPDTKWCQSGWLFGCYGSTEAGQQLSPIASTNECRKKMFPNGQCHNGKKHGDSWISKGVFEYVCNAGNIVFRGCNSPYGSGFHSVGTEWCERNGHRFTCTGSYTSGTRMRTLTGPMYKSCPQQTGVCFNGKKHGDTWSIRVFKFRCEFGKIVFKGCESRFGSGFHPVGSTWCEPINRQLFTCTGTYETGQRVAPVSGVQDLRCESRYYK